MDLHVYRNSQDRWNDLRAAARQKEAVLASDAVTLDELVQRLTPDVAEASLGQRLALVLAAVGSDMPLRHALDALGELRSVRVSPEELRKSGAPDLAAYAENYDALLRQHGLVDSHERRWLAASRVSTSEWLKRFDSVVLHALYDMNAAEYLLLHNLIDRLPGGGTVMLFNATANVKPTQFAEWTWQRFVHDEKLADKAFPEFVRSSGPARHLLDRLFVFDADVSASLLHETDSLTLLQCSGRYGEIESIGSRIAELLDSGADPGEIGVVVRHIDAYGEMIEDVFSRFGIACAFETGIPLLRVPFIKYWVAVLDLASGDRPRHEMARVLGSAYHEPRLDSDVEGVLSSIGYIDRRHLKASALAARQGSVLAAHIERFELFLDQLETANATPAEFMELLNPSPVLTARDLQAWQTLSDEIRATSAVTGPVTLERFRYLVSTISGMRTVGRLSGTIPGVQPVRVIPPSALGYRSYRWLFAPGFADGEIPAPSIANPLLQDERVQDLNAVIRPRRLQTSSDRNRKEPLYLFLLLDSATEAITLTWPGSTLEGEAIHRSIYVAEILRHYEDEFSRIPHSAAPRDQGAYFRAIASAWRDDLLEEAHVVELLGESLMRRIHWQHRGTERANLGADVLPVTGSFSPTELDKLEDCPFVFLARHRLRIRVSESPDFEVSPMEVGSLAHRILREFYTQPVEDSEEKAVQRMIAIIQRQLAPVDINGQGPHSVIDPSLWRIRRPQLVRALLEYVKFAVRDAQDGYETLAEFLEQPLPVASLGKVRLGGKPDRVAVRRTDGRLSGIRIDDFKYSAASSETNRQLKNSFQIPVYAHLAAKALEAGPEVPIEGRYLLLRSPSDPVNVHAVDSAVLEDVRERIEGLIEAVRLGRLQPAPADREDCRTCDYRRLCRLYGE